MYGRLGRFILPLVANVCFVFAGFFDNCTMYGSVSMGTPYINGNVEIEDDYKYNLGLRKIALFPYQNRDVFYENNDFTVETDNKSIEQICYEIGRFLDE